MTRTDDVTGSSVDERRPTRGAARSTPALAVHDLHKRFGPVAVLRGVDLVVEPDELVALVGENGVGKSTVVRCITGSDPRDGGSVTVAGHDVDGDGWRGLLEVVWQDLALCGNLDVVDNLFLGREGGWRLGARDELQVRAQALLHELGVHLPDLGVAVDQLSGGQRQSVALARTLLSSPALLVLDEPTAALGASGTDAALRLLRRMRARGVAILLISHDLDLVCQVADRALVLREGRIVDDVRRPRLTPEELKARITGLEPDSVAREQLHGLRSLVDQLSDVEPSAVVPLIVSALSLAVEHDGLAVHRVIGDELVMTAGLGVPRDAAARLGRLPLEGDAPLARAVTLGGSVVEADLRVATWPDADHLLRSGLRSCWTVPIVATDATLGTITGFGAAAGPVGEHVVELATLYASHAAAALERERLLTDLTHRNATLETLRQMLETLAGPVGQDAGLAIALDALRIGLDASDVALVDAGVDHADPDRVRLTSGPPGTGDGWIDEVAPPGPGTSALVRDGAGRAVLASTVPEEAHRYALLARWRPDEHPGPGARDLLADGVRAVRLALERRASEDARRETVALRRSNTLQRTFLSRLSHELRTPLTAIHGYADTLRQPDIEWDHTSTRSFLDTIARESGRLGELVTDLLDASSIEAGVLHLQLDWCDIALVVEAATASVPRVDGTHVEVHTAEGLPAARADHDRLEQVLVNLVGNAVHHTPPGTTVTVRTATTPDGAIRITVTDDGPGLPPRVRGDLFAPGVRAGGGSSGSGLGLSICRGIVEAHGGTIDLVDDVPGTCFEVVLPVDGPTADAAWTLADVVPASPVGEARA